MQKKIKLKYGTASCDINLPEKADQLVIREPVSQVNKETFTREFSLKLPDNLSDDPVISIVVADKTRLCGYKTYLPWILNTLFQKGIKKNRITFFIAYGTHARQSDKDCVNAYGDLYHRYRFIHHDCTDKTLFADMGTTLNGTRVHIRKDLLNSDLVITFGALSHHYFAGYGGGRKLLFPGLGYKPDIYQNHGLFLDKTVNALSLDCRPGNLGNNPLAEDLRQVDTVNKIPKVAIHGILDSKGTVSRLIVGNTYDDFLTACQTLDTFYKTDRKKRYSLVVASCGGFPKDINFIQAHKAINNAAMFVKDHGRLIVFAECADGIGSDAFIEYFNYHNFTRAFDVLAENYKGNGGTALSMMTKTKRINIFLKTALDDILCKIIGVQKIEDPMIKTLTTKFQTDMACIENASLLIR